MNPDEHRNALNADDTQLAAARRSMSLVGMRSLSQYELRRLTWIAWRLKVAGLFSMTALPVLGVVSYLALRGLNPEEEVVQRWWVLTFCISILGSFHAAIFGLELLLRAATCRIARACGQVLRYSGRFLTFEEMPSWLERLERRGILTFTPGARIEIELLPQGQILYQVNGMRMRRWMEVDMGLAANASLADVTSTTTPSLSQNREESEWRELSSAERTELAALIGRTRKLALSNALCTGALPVCLGLAIGWVSGSLLAGIAFGVPLFLLTVFGERTALKEWQGELQAELDVGYVQVTRTRDEEYTGIEVIEILPASGCTWTLDGKPVPWRRV